VQLRGWFPFVQLLPALLFSGLWLWDSRRRQLEQHPEIVRRRRARRELRQVKRLLKHAAARRDAPGFIQAAIKAMQVASAPHYPAHPRALVGGDVVEVLGSDNDATVKVVRSFFAAGDAAAFAQAAPSDEELLGMQPDLEKALGELEARL